MACISVAPCKQCGRGFELLIMPIVYLHAIVSKLEKRATFKGVCKVVGFFCFKLGKKTVEGPNV